MMHLRLLIVVLCFGILAGCMEQQKKMGENTFGNDLEFLKKHTEVVVLSDATGAGQVAVLPKMQGRVMTSTAGGTDGLSFGWINRELVKSGEFVEHINVFGGEDRFWMGPEGGQFSIFFKNGVPFDLEHWFTPASIDTEPFELVSKSKNLAILKKDMQLENYSRTVFNLRVDREVKILGRDDAVELLEITPAKKVKMVAFESTNKVTNTGEKAWEKETGLISIWILGMFNPSPATTVVVPFKAGPEDKLGATVNDAYFGKVPADRLVVKDGVLFFSGDGQYRGKIGLSPQRAKPILGSYDAVNQVLTIVQYSKPRGAKNYVNSPLGPFYELETSSPAAALKPGGTISHVHRTFHLQGSEADLDPIVRATLGVTIDEIKSAF